MDRFSFQLSDSGIQIFPTSSEYRFQIFSPFELLHGFTWIITFCQESPAGKVTKLLTLHNLWRSFLLNQSSHGVALRKHALASPAMCFISQSNPQFMLRKASGFPAGLYGFAHIALHTESELSPWGVSRVSEAKMLKQMFVALTGTKWF